MEKKSYDREPIDSSLVKSRDEIKQLILDQIKEANSILNMEVVSIQPLFGQSEK